MSDDPVAQQAQPKPVSSDLLSIEKELTEAWRAIRKVVVKAEQSGFQVLMLNDLGKPESVELRIGPHTFRQIFAEKLLPRHLLIVSARICGG